MRKVEIGIEYLGNDLVTGKFPAVVRGDGMDMTRPRSEQRYHRALGTFGLWRVIWR
ncbi:hypothetical protein [Microbulbifer discodermiae]|uniref:hypothetical protein n=1 Tax=Microbulbifer sp. 2201CG32-9 TaxID=3232309 RepID=UPI00345B62C2